MENSNKKSNIFKPTTPRIEKLAELFPDTIAELEKIFNAPTNIYIDWQNVIHWQDKLGWHIHTKRLKQLFDSFDTIKKVSVYTGTLDGNEKSQEMINELKDYGYQVETKPVKIMPYSIDVSSIPTNSPALLQPFIKKPLLSVLNIKTIETINGFFSDLNKQGTFYLEDRKCNFDVEIGRDIFLDLNKGDINNFVLWSGDSDFVDPINAVRKAGKEVFLFSTSGRVSSELAELKTLVFEIKKIKEFICWPKEIPQSVKDKIDL